MKIFAIALGFLVLSTPVFAGNRVPVSEAQRYIAACPAGAPALYSCEDKPEEPCLEFSHIDDWCAVDLVTDGNGVSRLVNNATKKAAKDKEKKDKKDQEDAKATAAKALDFSKDMNAKELTAAMKALVEALKAKGIL